VHRLAIGASYVPAKRSTSSGLVLGIQVYSQQPQQIGSVLLVHASTRVDELFSAHLRSTPTLSVHVHRQAIRSHLSQPGLTASAPLGISVRSPRAVVAYTQTLSTLNAYTLFSCSMDVFNSTYMVRITIFTRLSSGKASTVVVKGRRKTEAYHGHILLHMLVFA
jgi:hypothetical protein